MGNKDYKFDAHKGFESFWAQAMMYSMILKDRYEPDTYICSPLRAETVKRLEMNVSAVRAYMSYAIMEMGLSATAPHAFLPMVLKGCVDWAKENNVELITAEHMQIINDKRAKEKNKK